MGLQAPETVHTQRCEYVDQNFVLPVLIAGARVVVAIRLLR